MIKFVKLLEATSAWKPCQWLQGSSAWSFSKISTRIHKIAYGFGGPIEKKCQSSLIFSCKIPILSLVSVLSKIFQILWVISDRMDKFCELQDYLFKFMNNFVFKFLIRLIIRRTSMIICIILWMWNTMQMAGSFYITKFFGSIFYM